MPYSFRLTFGSHSRAGLIYFLRLKLRVSFKGGPHSRAGLFQGFTVFLEFALIFWQLCSLSMQLLLYCLVLSFHVNSGFRQVINFAIQMGVVKLKSAANPFFCEKTSLNFRFSELIRDSLSSFVTQKGMVEFISATMPFFYNSGIHFSPQQLKSPVAAYD